MIHYKHKHYCFQFISPLNTCSLDSNPLRYAHFEIRTRKISCYSCDDLLIKQGNKVDVFIDTHEK